jgi:hypothetical protein
MLNHYIGMKSLEDAANFERQHAGTGVALVAVLGVAALFWPSWRFGWLAAVPGWLLPAGFLVDSLYWLYRFGHDLDPRAPVEIPGFTPEMFGNGTIGQFMTFAQPAAGFWIAVAGAACFAAAGLLRQRAGGRSAKPARGLALLPSAVAGPLVAPSEPPADVRIAKSPPRSEPPHEAA